MDELYEEYRDRLIRCGYSPCEAFFVYHDFMRETGEEGLKDYLNSLEAVVCGSNSTRTLRPEM